MKKVFIRVDELSIEFPGSYTVGLPVCKLIKSGWVVPLRGLQNLSGEHALVEAIVHARETSRAICGWSDGQNVLWDVVHVTPDEAEATYLGKKMGQMMIYQIETGKVKWLQ